MKKSEQVKIDKAIRYSLNHWVELTNYLKDGHQHDVEMLHIQPGKPNQNAYIERFNRTFRREIFNAYLFTSLDQVREISWQWLIDYNEERPHDAQNGLTPTAYREKVAV